MSQQQLSALEIQALRETCRMAAAAHDDSLARRRAGCEPWCFCTCRVAESLREADVAICKLEYRPNDGGWATKKASLEAGQTT